MIGMTTCGPFSPFERDDRESVALHALGVDAVVVVPLVHRARLGAEAASAERVNQRRDVQRLVATGALDTPRERQAGAGAGGEMQLVPVEGAGSAGTDRAAVAPGGVRVAVLLAHGATL